MLKIEKICVIGAGVMGAGIAAQIANSKTQVLLLDIMPDAASKAKEKMLSGKMPQLAHPTLLEYIAVGDLNESLPLLGECDWIIEVIVEKLEAKAELYNKIQPFMKKDAVLSSNTSTLPMSSLRASLLQTKHNFLLTHFFNPPRQMQLVELIYDDQTNSEIVKVISKFITNDLGKNIVHSNDTPGFIANRIGCFLMELCLKEAWENKLSIEEIDNYFSTKLGLPTTGIFGLFDLIGLDVMQMISEVLVQSLPQTDVYVKTYERYGWYDKMMQDGYKGRKGLGGFYRMREEGGKKVKEVLDFSTMEYKKCQPSMDVSTSKISNQIENILKQFFAYVDSLVGVVTDSKEDIDTAIELGYSWKYGPFKMHDLWLNPNAQKELGSKKVVIEKIVLENKSASLYFNEEGALIFSFKTKMNVLDPDVFTLLIEAIDYAEQHEIERLIIMNPGKHFSAGADLKLFLQMAEKEDYDAVEEFLKLGQNAMLKVKYSKVPVVACAKGIALGGGCELLLHCHKVVAHLDLAAGLVEVGVGLVPGWGGVKEMILRAAGNKDILIKNLRNIMIQNKTSSAYQFFADYMIEDGIVVMNENQLLEKAMSCLINGEKKVFSIKDRFFSSDINLLGSFEDLKTQKNVFFILKSLQEEINSYSLSEERILAIERKIFKELLATPEAIEKIRKIVRI